MNIYQYFAFILSFLIAILLGPLVINIAKRIKASQTILHYVKEHESKQGTPTMGGFIFIIPTFICGLMFIKTDYVLSIITLFVMLAYCILGFLDDFIKIKFKQNEGLKPYQKIIGQVGISLIVAFFAYKNGLVGTEISIPFLNNTIDLGVFIIPFIVLVYTAFVNSVNLIDGLDGLCGGTTIGFLIPITTILLIISNNQLGALYVETINLSTICICLIGALIGFLCFNIFPAKIFMGDTGSLAIGGFLASVMVFSKLELLILIIGFMYVITAISDIIQVLHFKRTKKRIFLMAPLHHHFQKKGIHENKIVFWYFVVTLIIGTFSVVGYLI